MDEVDERFTAGSRHGRVDGEADRAPAPWTEARPPARHRSAFAPEASANAPDPAQPGQAPPAARRPWLRWAAIGLALLIALGAGWWAWGRFASGGEKQAAAPPRVPVEVAKAETADLPVYLEGLGTVQAFNAVTVRSRVDGEIVRIAFTEGQVVQAGDLLAQIDPRPYQAALDQAIARKAQTEATLASNNQDLERTRQLASRSFATQQQLDQQTATVGAAEAQIAADQAAIESARTQLDYATIRAPLTGRLGLRLVDQGNIVRASDATGIVQITQTQPISVLFTAPEGQLHAISDAQAAGPVAVVALATDAKTPLGTGTLALVNNEVDAASGTVRLKATFANEDGRLWPGLSVNTRLLVRTVKGAVVVPDVAVQRGQNQLFVFGVGPDGKAQKRVVEIGPFSDGRVQIAKGLAAGDTVVTAGQSRLTEGALVDPGGDSEKGDTGKAPDASRQENRAASPSSGGSGGTAGGRRP